VGHQNVDGLQTPQTTQTGGTNHRCDPSAHLRLGVLVGARPVSDRAAETGQAKPPLVDDALVEVDSWWCGRD